MLGLFASPVWAEEGTPIATEVPTATMMAIDFPTATPVEMTPTPSSDFPMPDTRKITDIGPVPKVTSNPIELIGSDTPTVVETPTETPVETATPTVVIKKGKKGPTPSPTPSVTSTPTDSFVFAHTPTIKDANVTVIPNPARGKKLTFRIMVPAPSNVFIRVYDSQFDLFDEIKKSGDQLFDVLWSLKKVDEGMYYYQVQVEDQATGKITKLPMKKFAVIK